MNTIDQYTPITIFDYMKLVNPTWEGQTRVDDNHCWQCWLTADGRRVRTQGQNVPDSLLNASDLAVSNAAKYRFEVVANGTTYKLTELQVGTVDELMRQYQASGADTGTHEEVYEQLIKQELALVPRVFTELGISFDVLLPTEGTGRNKKEPKLSFEYRASDVSSNEYYDLILDGQKFDSVHAKQPENIVTGLVSHFGYKLGTLIPVLPECLHALILRRVGVWVSADTYELMDTGYTCWFKYSDGYEGVTQKMGYSFWKKLRAAGFDSSRSVSAALFAGSLTHMPCEEREELLGILKLQRVPEPVETH